MESKKGDRRQDELVEDRKQEIMRILPGEIRQKVQSLSIDWEGLQEIRLRVGKPVILRYRQKNISWHGVAAWFMKRDKRCVWDGSN